jgi:hypothetical protein
MDPSGAELAVGLERWASLVGDFSEAWPHITKLIHRHNLRTFRSEGSATGPKRRWAALSPRYAAWKSRRFPGRPILVLSGALRRALTQTGRGALVKSSKGSLEVGIKPGKTARIAGYHQRGVPPGDGSRMPARPPVQFVRSLRNKNSLPFVVSQMLQRIVVDHRKAALGSSAGVFDADTVERRLGSLEALSRRRTE